MAYLPQQEVLVYDRKSPDPALVGVWATEVLGEQDPILYGEATSELLEPHGELPGGPTPAVYEGH